MRREEMNETIASTSVRALLLTVPLVLGGAAMAASETTDPPASVSTGDTGAASLPMREQMHAMRQQMERMHAAGPEERRQMMHQHMGQMQRMMDMMHGMMAGQGMMGGHRTMEGRGPGMPSGEHMSPQRGSAGNHGQMRSHEATGMAGGVPCTPQTGAHPGNAPSGIEMLEERLNVMQLMMDQMLQSQKELLEELNKGAE
jgi:hypothetical protein